MKIVPPVLILMSWPIVKKSKNINYLTCMVHMFKRSRQGHSPSYPITGILYLITQVISFWEVSCPLTCHKGSSLLNPLCLPNPSTLGVLWGFKNGYTLITPGCYLERIKEDVSKTFLLKTRVNSCLKGFCAGLPRTILAEPLALFQGLTHL